MHWRIKQPVTALAYLMKFQTVNTRQLDFHHKQMQ